MTLVAFSFMFLRSSEDMRSKREYRTVTRSMIAFHDLTSVEQGAAAELRTRHFGCQQ